MSHRIEESQIQAETVEERVDALDEARVRSILGRIVRSVVATHDVTGTADILHENCLISNREAGKFRTSPDRI